jgi:predicted nucleic acid-binding protein
MNSNIEFIAPEYTFTEILKHTDIIEKKAKLAPKDMQYVMDMLFSRITIYPKEEYAECYDKAKELMKDIDPDDAPFLALAMKTKVDGIWSEDKGFQQQNHVKIYTTKELLEFI